jgi:hypothetical protein
LLQPLVLLGQLGYRGVLSTPVLPVTFDNILQLRVLGHQVCYVFFRLGQLRTRRDRCCACEFPDPSQVFFTSRHLVPGGPEIIPEDSLSLGDAFGYEPVSRQVRQPDSLHK